MCTYLDQVGATYYFRRAVPQELQPYLLTANGKPRTEFKISLRTKDRETAKRKLREYAEATDIAFDKARAALARDQAPPAAPLSPTDARRERAELEYDEGLAVFEAQRSAEHDARVEEAEVLEARLKLPSDQLSATERAAALLLRDLEEDRDRYRGRYRRRKLRDAQDAHTAPEKASTAPAQARTPCGAQHGSQGKSDGVSISGLYEKYATQPGIRIRPSTIKQWRAYIENLIDFLGEDSAEGVSPKSLILWREHLRTLPGRGGKPLSPKTINDSYLAAARVTFDYGLNNLLIEANPIAGVQKVRTERKVRLRERDFTNAERKAILRAALAGTSGRVSDHRRLAVRWVPWLCAYTGARVNEITQLRAEDVKQIDGVWTIHITPEAGGVKTDQARTVPIHEHLVAQGFLEVVKSKAGPLFYVATDDGADSDRGQHKRTGMWLAAWVRNEVGITDPNVAPNHGWRHTFKTICREAEIDESAADYMQGHAHKAQGRQYGSNTLPALSKQLAKFPRFEVDEGSS
jgi:integrase